MQRDVSAGQFRIYVDGILETSAALTVIGNIGDQDGEADPLVIGAGGSPTTIQHFAGQIDEAQIYNRALSASEIASIYNPGNDIGCQGTAVFTSIASNGKIAFVSDRVAGNSYEIFTMNADGTNQTNITNNVNEDAKPSWSSDGSKIVFRRTVNANSDIYVMNADGSNQVRLTTDISEEDYPGFSPDGTKIVFNSSRNSGAIYVMNSDGTNQVPLTSSSVLTSNFAPQFSPDGSRILFTSGHHGDGGEIYVMNADGSNLNRLTNNSVLDGFPAWSPDGTKIVFHRRPVTSEPNDYEVFVMNANGSNAVNISNYFGFDGYPQWSPDGSKIIFDTSRTGNRDIYSMNTDGTNPIRLVNNSSLDVTPTWQPIRANVSVAPASNLNVVFSNVSQAGYIIATPLSAAMVPALPNGLIFFGGAPIYDIRTSAAYSGNITVRFNVSNVSSASVCNELRMIHFENGGWTTSVNAAPVYNSATQICALSQTVTSLSPFAVIQLAPLAADVSVSGRVLTANGRGITNTIVTITDANGATRSTLTGSFGFYNFDNVRAGETYIVQVKSKSFSFDQPAQIISVQENVGELDFIANESR